MHVGVCVVTLARIPDRVPTQYVYAKTGKVDFGWKMAISLVGQREREWITGAGKRGRVETTTTVERFSAGESGFSFRIRVRSSYVPRVNRYTCILGPTPLTLSSSLSDPRSWSHPVQVSLLGSGYQRHDDSPLLLLLLGWQPRIIPSFLGLLGPRLRITESHNATLHYF